jgi:hypothetical protein
MTKTILRILLPFLVLGLFSCKKDNNNVNPAVLSGEWRFTSISGNEHSVENDGGKVDDSKEYTSTQCTGTVNIDGGVMKYDSVKYTVEGSEIIISYQNNLTDSNHVPYNYTFPATSGYTIATSFVTVGTDSIHFSNNSGLPGSGGLNNPPSSGAKFSISGNTLTLTSSFFQINPHDRTATLVGTVVTILTRQ